MSLYKLTAENIAGRFNIPPEKISELESMLASTFPGALLTMRHQHYMEACAMVDAESEAIPNRPEFLDFQVVQQVKRSIVARIQTALSADFKPSEHPLKLPYINWEGEFEVRSVTPIRLWYGQNGWHNPDQWLLDCYCHDRKAFRTFSWIGIVEGITESDVP